MPGLVHNPNLSRGNSNLSVPRTPNPRQTPRGQQSRDGSIQMTSLPVSPGVSQKKPPPKKDVPVLGVTNQKAPPTKQTEGNSNTDLVAPISDTPSVIIQTPVKNGIENQNEKDAKREKKKKPKADNEDYSDDFETDDDSEDAIDVVREATFKYNQEEFERKMRALSAESNLPEFNEEEYEQCLSSRQQELTNRQTQHEDWLESFQQKKNNILERLGILLKNRSDRFHDVCDLFTLTPRRAAHNTQKHGDKSNEPVIPPDSATEKQGEWPEVVDVGRQIKDDYAID